ncbi:MAG: enoyl-CoA hydratase/isomerase family protein [Firmicutes bacterium]|nr:enoyl-CoA hydratase/isomerase family protein [Bacillota bacterium]
MSVFRGTRLRVEEAEGVAMLTLTRPEARNAMDGAMLGEWMEALDRLEARPAAACRVLVLRGEGPVFCAGADLNYLKALGSQSLEARRVAAHLLGRLLQRLAAFPAPVLCVVQGAAMGAGLALTTCADVVLATPEARIALPEVRLGLAPSVVLPFVARRLGPSHTAPLLLSGRTITGLQAQAAGLVHRSSDDLESALADELREHLQADPEASRRAKALLLRLQPLPDEAQVAFGVDRLVEALGSKFGEEG